MFDCPRKKKQKFSNTTFALRVGWQYLKAMTMGESLLIKNLPPLSHPRPKSRDTDIPYSSTVLLSFSWKSPLVVYSYLWRNDKDVVLQRVEPYLLLDADEGQEHFQKKITGAQHG